LNTLETMSLRYNGQEIALVSFSGMTAQKALGGWLLRFSLTFEPKPVPTSPHFSFKADGVYDLRVHASVAAGASGPLFLGVAHCRQQRFFAVNDMAQRQGHLFDLSLLEGQLAAIEDLRGSGGVAFQFDVFAQGSGSLGAQPMETSLRQDFNLSEWTKRLAEMGAAEYLCVPMLLPRPGAGDPHEPAIKHLRRAQEAALRGDWRAAVASCRESLELLTELQQEAFAGTNLTTQAVIQSFGPRRKQMSREERLVFLRVAALQLTHLGHHPTDNPRDVLSRQDASLAIAACAGLLSASMADGFAPLAAEQPDDAAGTAP
jgi:hypothetical protein